MPQDLELSGVIFVVKLDKAMQGDGRLERLELSGMIFLLNRIRECKETGGRRTWSSRDRFPCCLMRNYNVGDGCRIRIYRGSEHFVLKEPIHV